MLGRLSGGFGTGHLKPVPWYGCQFCYSVPNCINSPTKVCDAITIFIHSIENQQTDQFIFIPN